MGGERIGCESKGMELLVNQSNAGKGYELQMGDQLELVSKEYVEEFFFSEDEFEHDSRTTRTSTSTTSRGRSCTGNSAGTLATRCSRTSSSDPPVRASSAPPILM